MSGTTVEEEGQGRESLYNLLESYNTVTPAQPAPPVIMTSITGRPLPPPLLLNQVDEDIRRAAVPVVDSLGQHVIDEHGDKYYVVQGVQGEILVLINKTSPVPNNNGDHLGDVAQSLSTEASASLLHQACNNTSDTQAGSSTTVSQDSRQQLVMRTDEHDTQWSGDYGVPDDQSLETLDHMGEEDHDDEWSGDYPADDQSLETIDHVGEEDVDDPEPPEREVRVKKKPGRKGKKMSEKTPAEIKAQINVNKCRGNIQADNQVVEQELRDKNARISDLKNKIIGVEKQNRGLKRHADPLESVTVETAGYGEIMRKREVVVETMEKDISDSKKKKKGEPGKGKVLGRVLVNAKIELSDAKTDLINHLEDQLQQKTAQYKSELEQC